MINRINDFFEFDYKSSIVPINIPLIYVPHRVSGLYISEEDGQELGNISAEVLWAIEESHHKRIKKLGIPDCLDGLQHLLELTKNEKRMIAANRFFHNYKTSKFEDVYELLEKAKNGKTALYFLSSESGEEYEPLTSASLDILLGKIASL